MPKKFKDLTEREILGAWHSTRRRKIAGSMATLPKGFARAIRLRPRYSRTCRRKNRAITKCSSTCSGIGSGPHPADPAAGREGLYREETNVVGAAAGDRIGAPAGGGAGTGDATVLRKVAPENFRPSYAQVVRRLAEIEQQHSNLAEALEEKHLDQHARTEEENTGRRLFMLQVIQPGLAGLMDGSVSTLAPILRRPSQPIDPRRVPCGIAASLGAGISMAFAEALSDDGSLTGRGRPVVRGLVTGLMTAAGGLGHTLPFLISSFHVAFAAAVVVVAVELAIISWVRHRYMDTPLLSSAFQVVVGGVLVFVVGVWIGSSLDRAA